MNNGEDRLIRRLRYLWTWELFDSFLLPAMAIFLSRYLERPLGFFSIASAGLVAWILWQGATYWWLKLQAVKSDSEIQHLRRFETLKRVNWALIGLLPILLMVNGLISSFFRSGLDFVVGLGFYVLAALEQINYYHIQLMYDYPPDWRYLVENKRLKRSSLNRALERVHNREVEG
jgi:hypothetical protein